jgi:hypothetical protein
VVAAAANTPGARSAALVAIAIEAILVASVVAASRGAVYAQSLLKVRLAHSVTHLVLGKAITLRLGDFEDPTLNDRLEEARSEAAVRPLSLVIRTFTLVRYAISLAGYSVLLVQLSPWAVLALIAAGVPVFVVEARFSREAFRFFRRHSPENRVRHYLEMILTREDFGKEIGFFGLGKILLGRRRSVPRRHEKDRRIAVSGTRGPGAQHRRDGRVLRRVRVDRARDDRRPAHVRTDDDVPRRVPPGTSAVSSR